MEMHIVAFGRARFSVFGPLRVGFKKRRCVSFSKISQSDGGYETFNVTDDGGVSFNVTDGGGEAFNVKN